MRGICYYFVLEKKSVWTIVKKNPTFLKNETATLLQNISSRLELFFSY